MSRQQTRGNSTCWMFTINNPTMQDDPKLWEPKYCVYQTEQGENGTIHYQGYCIMPKKKSLVAMKALCPRAHFERRKGSHRQARDYCTKEATRIGEVHEFGTPPHQGKRTDIEKFVSWSREQTQQPTLDTILTMHPGILAKHPRFCDMVLNTVFSAKPLKELNNVWYHGVPRCGKSLTARVNDFGNIYNKAPNKWWDGYRNPEVVLIEDLDTSHKYMGYFLKIWADSYPFRAECKGSSMEIRPSKIVITSNFSINEIFSEDVMIARAIKSRFKEVEMFPDEDNLQQLISKYNYLIEAETGEDVITNIITSVSAEELSTDSLGAGTPILMPSSPIEHNNDLNESNTMVDIARALADYRIPLERKNAFVLHDLDSEISSSSEEN